MKTTPARLKQVLDTFNQARKTITTTPRLRHRATQEEERAAQEAVKGELAASRAQTIEKVRALKDETITALDQAKNALNAGILPIPTDTNAALLQEMQLHRAWQRIEPLLRQEAEKKYPGEIAAIERIDQLSGVSSVVTEEMERALRTNDNATILAIRQEAPYLIGRYFGQQAQQSLGDDVLQQIAKARPEVAATVAELQDLERGAWNISLSIEGVIRAFEADRALVSITDWDGQNQQVILSDSATIHLPRGMALQVDLTQEDTQGAG